MGGGEEGRNSAYPSILIRRLLPWENCHINIVKCAESPFSLNKLRIASY